MDDKQLTAGLNLLADEFANGVDIDAVIETERVRTRRRRSVAAVAMAIVVLLTAVSVVTLTMNVDQGSQGASPPTTQTSPTRKVINGKLAANRVVDDESRKLTGQLDAAKATLLPNLQIAPDPENTDNIQEGTPPALEFGKLFIDDGTEQPQEIQEYEAFAKLTDQQGVATIRISVSDNAAQRQDLDCLAGRSDCTSQVLPDGTKASWHTHIGDAMGWNQNMVARRPDGTLTVVSLSVWTIRDGDRPTRPEVPLTQEQLYKFATVFTY